MDSSGERSHRQLIDCIRSKDTDALIDAIDAGGEEINGHFVATCWYLRDNVIFCNFFLQLLANE